MIVNFFGVLFLNISFFSLGILFQNKIHNFKSKKLSLFETIFFGIFFVTLASILFNFFVGLHSLFFLFFLFGILIYSIFKFNKLLIKNLNFFLLLALILAPISTYLNFGYDSGLYHIPFQTIIQNEKISFGLANLHMRYGLTTSYSYVAALLWFDNTFNLVAIFSTILFSLFFIFMYERISSKNPIDHIFIIPVIVSLPLWYRYSVLSISQVDLFFSIFFYFSFFYGTQIIFYINKYDETLKKKISIFIIFLSYTITTKPSAAIILIYVILILFIKYKILLNNLFQIIKSNLISIIFVLMWILRNIIISSCIFYPIKISCIDFSWKTNSIESINLTIQIWNSVMFNKFLNYLTDYFFLIVILLVIAFLVILYSRKIINLIYFNKVFFLLFSSISLIFLTLYTKPPVLIMHLIQTNQNLLLNKLFFDEILFLISFYSLSLIFLILIFKQKVKFKNFSKLNFYSFIPFVFFIINFLLWIKFAPNPRLGQYLFLIVMPSFLIIFINLSTHKIFNYIKYFKFYILIIFFKIFIFNNANLINKRSIVFKNQSVPIVKLQSRQYYGFSPKNSENLCWNSLHCHPYSEVKIYKKLFNYKFFKEIKS